MSLECGETRPAGEGDGETGEHTSSRKTIPKAALVLSAALLVMRSAQTFYVPILPLYIRILDASIPLFVVGMVTGVHRLGAVFVNPVAGRWCDRIGYIRPFLIGVIGMSLACMLASMAFKAGDLTLYLAISGAGYATVTISALAYVTTVTTTGKRATAMGLLSASGLAGAAIGPLPGGFIADAFSPPVLGYRATFLCGGLVVLVGGISAFIFIRRWRGNPQSVAISKPSFQAVFRNRGLLITCAADLLYCVSHGAFLYFTVPLLGDSLGFSAARIGWIISGFGIGHATGALILGPLSDRVGRRKPFVFGAIFGLGMIILLLSQLGTALLSSTATFAIGFVASPCCGIVPALAAELLPGAPSTAISVQKSSEQLGVFLGPMVGGALIGAFGYRNALIGYSAIALLGSLMFLFGVTEPNQYRVERKGR